MRILGSRWGLTIVAAAVTAIASISSAPASTRAAVPPLGRHLLQTRGMFTEFERPNSPSGWATGDLLYEIASSRARPSVANLLNRMRAMGVTEVLFEMRSADDFYGGAGFGRIV